MQVTVPVYRHLDVKEQDDCHFTGTSLKVFFVHYCR